MKLRTLISLPLPIAVAVVATVACGAHRDEDVGTESHAIVGGVEAQPGIWAGTVAIYKNGTQACAGALVADEWVLTAGHCVTPGTPDGGVQRVVINRHRLSGSDGEVLTVKKAIRHAGFSTATLDNDIALLQLAARSTAPVAKVISAAQLTNIVANRAVTIVGWGRMAENGETSDVLREVSVAIVSNEQCRTYQNYEDVTSNMICAGLPKGGKDACQGDSGGPLFMKIDGQTLEVGLVSWGIGCARASAPGVYTNLGKYNAWLARQTNGVVGELPPPSDGGVPFTPFEESGSVARDQEKAYAYDAPEGTYDIGMSGTSDADLYVRMNAPPTIKDYDCRPFTTGSNEKCEVTLSAPGKLYVMVRGYASGGSNYTVKGYKL